MDWTPETLLYHLTESLRLRDDRLIAELAAVREAVALAREASRLESEAHRAALDHRLEGLNELRKVVERHDESYAPSLKVAALEDRVAELSARIEKSEGVRLGAARLWALLTGLPGLIAIIWTALK